MSALLLAAMLTVGADQPPQASAAPNVSGKWLVVYAEQRGRRNNSWEQQQATMQDGTLTYQADGKEQTLNLKFGPNQTVTASHGNDNGHHGVYIASRDYFCISLQGGAHHEGGEGREGTATGGNNQHHSSGSFILILRRSRSTGAGK